jgi:hypothetical protein
MYVYRNVEARSCNHCSSGKAINVTYSECLFLALNIQQCAILSRVACPTLQFFFLTISLQRAEMRCLRSVKGYTRLDKISEIVRKELQISGLQDVRSTHKIGSDILKECVPLDCRNMPSITNLEEEDRGRPWKR